MTVHYKATRLDGTDFRTGTVRYEVGATVEHPRSVKYRDMRPNDPSTYLSASVEPGEVLTGGSWPCRLFRVEPAGRTVKRTDGAYGFKRGCRALRVVEELPAHVALGPNGQEVAAFIERCRALTVDEVGRLAAARATAWDAARAAAGATAGATAWATAWDAAWDAARAAAGAAARAAAGDAARAAAGAAAWDAAGAAARDAARVAAWDAARALTVRDLITPAQFGVLCEPWRSVIEEAA
jgi:hypothetical protein